MVCPIVIFWFFSETCTFYRITTGIYEWRNVSFSPFVDFLFKPANRMFHKQILYFFLGCVSGWVVGGGLKRPRIVSALSHSRRPQQAIHRNRLKAPNAFFLQIMLTFHVLSYTLKLSFVFLAELRGHFDFFIFISLYCYSLYPYQSL